MKKLLNKLIRFFKCHSIDYLLDKLPMRVRKSQRTQKFIALIHGYYEFKGINHVPFKRIKRIIESTPGQATLANENIKEHGGLFVPMLTFFYFGICRHCGFQLRKTFLETIYIKKGEKADTYFLLKFFTCPNCGVSCNTMVIFKDKVAMEKNHESRIKYIHKMNKTGKQPIDDTNEIIVKDNDLIQIL